MSLKQCRRPPGMCPACRKAPYRFYVVSGSTDALSTQRRTTIQQPGYRRLWLQREGSMAETSKTTAVGLLPPMSAAPSKLPPGLHGVIFSEKPYVRWDDVAVIDNVKQVLQGGVSCSQLSVSSSSLVRHP